MHVLLLYQYYNNPDCAAAGRHYRFMGELAARHEVTVITTDALFKTRPTQRFPLAPPGVTVRMLHVPYTNEMSIAGRLRAYTQFAAGALREALSVPRPDCIIGSSTPLTAAWAAARLASWFKIPWIFEVRDLWPDFPIQMGLFRSPWMQQRLYALEARLYRDAAHIIPLSPDMEAHILSKRIPASKVTTILNGSDLEFVPAPGAEAGLRQRHGLGDRTVVLYAGTLGRANDIPTLVEAARRLAHRPDLVFVFVGAGYHAGLVQRASETLPNLVLLPPVPHHEVFGWFRLASLSLVTFLDLPVLGANSPAKFFDSLSSGTPVLVGSRGWMRAFVEAHGCGWPVPAGDAAALAAHLEALLASPAALQEAGRRGRAVAERLFDRTQLARQFVDVVETAARPPRR